MIRISSPCLERHENNAKLITNVKIDKEIHSIYVSVEREYEKYLVSERNDAMLIALIPYAIRHEHDIICDAPISEDLLYNIKIRLLPTLKKGDDRIYIPNIKCNIVSEPYSSEGGCGTGISCGVDSFHTIYTHLDLKEKNYNLTHLAIFNTGSFNAIYSSTGLAYVKEKVWDRAEKVAKELRLTLVKVDSNISNEIIQNHLYTHSYTDAFAIYSLGKLWKKYYYASTYYEEKVNFKDNLTHDCSYYEELLWSCLSFGGISIYLDGAQGTRNDKVKMIAEFKTARRYLHVCTYGENNCGRCEKCRRTLLAADAEGVIDSFRDVFDIKYYKEHLSEYYDFICRKKMVDSGFDFYQETFDKLYARNKETFDKYMDKYSIQKFDEENRRLSDWLNRWRKYCDVFKRMVDYNDLIGYITDYFQSRTIESIAFYGDGELRRYLDTIIKEIGIDIKYIVEDFPIQGIDYPRYSRTCEIFNDVGCVIVTDVFASETTINKIRRTNRCVVTAEDLLLSGYRTALQT